MSENVIKNVSSRVGKKTQNLELKLKITKITKKVILKYWESNDFFRIFSLIAIHYFAKDIFKFSYLNAVKCFLEIFIYCFMVCMEVFL